MLRFIHDYILYVQMEDLSKSLVSRQEMLAFGDDPGRVVASEARLTSRTPAARGVEGR